MKIHIPVIFVWCLTIDSSYSQFFYSHYTQFAPIPQPYQLPEIQQRSTGNAGEFRGFSYHTDYQDGASSNVFLITGPQAKNFINFDGLFKSKARSLASDSLDTNSIGDLNKRIENILLKPNNLEDLYQIKMPDGVVQYYSLPAGTVPLTTEAPEIKQNATEIDTAESVVSSTVISTPNETTTEASNSISTEVNEDAKTTTILAEVTDEVPTTLKSIEENSTIVN